MSVSIMAKVFENETLGPTPRLILLSLADHANEDGQCYPSIARLCRRTGLTERAVQKHIKALQADGYIDIAYGEGRSGSNLYTVRATPRTSCTPASETPPHHVPPAQDAPPHEVHPTPRTSCTSTPAPRAPKSSGNHHLTTKQADAAAPTFSAFWEIWPNKNAKGQAEKNWKKLRAEDKRQAIAAVKAGWFDRWRAGNPQAAPIHPGSFLSGKRWTDQDSPTTGDSADDLLSKMQRKYGGQ